jgi:hypothetical protein
VAVIAFAYRLIRRRKQRYRDELHYRCGQAEFSRYVEQARATLGRGEADYILLLSTVGLPHGDSRWLRIALKAGPSAQCDLSVWEPTQRVLQRTGVTMPDAVVQELLGLLDSWDLAALSDAPSHVIDGVPCRLAILRREPWAVAVAGCNLFDEYDPQHPTLTACTALYDLAWRRLSPGHARS